MLKILTQLFTGFTSKLEVMEVESTDFKIVKYSGTQGYRRRASVWFAFYHHIDKTDKEQVAKLATQFNNNCDRIKALYDRNQEIKEHISRISEATEIV